MYGPLQLAITLVSAAKNNRTAVEVLYRPQSPPRPGHRGEPTQVSTCLLEDRAVSYPTAHLLLDTAMISGKESSRSTCSCSSTK